MNSGSSSSFRSALLLLLALLHSSLAPASGDLSLSFQKAGLKIPQALERLGYRQFGSSLDLGELQGGMKSITVSENPALGRQNTQGRVSGRWQCQSGACTIAVNAAWWRKFPEQQPALALHEYLGALGYYDDDYWITTSMWFLSLPDAQRLLPQSTKAEISSWIAKNAAVKLPAGTKLAGGVVGVGGGGESASLWARMQGLERQLKTLKNPATTEEEKKFAWAMIDHYLRTNLAVMWDPGN